MQIITISGVDGSGKSTQANHLITHYKSQGKKVYYLHAVAFSIAQKLLKRHPQKSRKSADTGLSQSRASWNGILLRKIALIIDLCRFAFLRRQLHRQSYDYIISDRFFFDTVVNIRYLEGTQSIGILERIVPRTTAALLFTIAPEVIMHRDRAPEQGIAYLRAKTALFAQRAPLWRMHTVNANQVPHTVSANILNMI